MVDNKKHSLSDPSRRLFVRNAELADVPGIIDLSERVYRGTGMYGYSAGSLNGQIHAFPEGQFVAVLGEQIVGYCATFLISGDICLRPHTWTEITGNGYASRHDPEAEWLYGMEVCVDPDMRGYRIGQRLYNARKQLCQDMALQGMVFAGRLPTLAKRLACNSDLTSAPAKPPITCWRRRSPRESRSSESWGYCALHMNNGTSAARAANTMRGQISISITRP